VINTAIFGVETILFIRHGEKPIDGLGQLSCKGINRSLFLPNVILNKFGTPDLLVAPNPVIQKEDRGIFYNYLRPLATLEPLAIKTSQNIDLSCGYNDIDCIANLLLENKYNDKVVLVVWEHHNIDDIIKKIASNKGVTLNIPNWESDDFDTIYVIKLGKNFINFNVDIEGLNQQNADCSF
jgi:hypothetical protein